MFAKAALAILSILLSGCSIDTFDALYRITGMMKENVAVSMGLVDVDTQGLVDFVTGCLESTDANVKKDGSFVFSDRTLACAGPVDSILPQASQELLARLSYASENKAKRSELARVLSAKADEDLSTLARNTVSFLEGLVCGLEDEEMKELLSSFLIQRDEYTLCDIIALETILGTLSTSLEFFDAGTVTLDDINQAFSLSMGSVDRSYIDSISRSTGQGKSVATAIGASWLYNAFDNLLLHAREALQ